MVKRQRHCMSKSKHIKNTHQLSTCVVCGVDFEYLFVTKPKKFCSIRCYRKHHVATHKEQWRAYKKKYRSKPGIKEKELAYKLSPAQKEKTKQYYLNNKAKVLEWGREWKSRKRTLDPEYRARERERLRNIPDSSPEKKIAYKQKSIIELKDHYVNDIIRMEIPFLRGKAIPIELTNLKRKTIQLKRLAYEKQ